MVKFLKTKFLLIFSTVTVWLLGAVGVSRADLVDTVISAATTIPRIAAEVLIYLGIGAGISFGGLGIAQKILNWVIDPNFLRVSFTGPDNLIVTIGWTTVRDLTNLMFILVLIVIGLATALRIKEYQVQKTLPILIGIALLINFTPVICGVIIDASNIMMNMFLTKGVEGAFNETVNMSSTSWGIIWSSLEGLLTHPEDLVNGTFFVQTIVFIIFNTISAFILLLFAGLLLMRSIALWILVIFSPLAFFCYILPATRKIWNQWWHNFIQWCFVGVGGMFFLYLTQLMMREINIISGPAYLGSNETYTKLGGIMLNFIPLILLGAGAYVTMSTSAMGANVITGFAKKMQGKATGSLKKFAGAKTKRGLSGAGRALGNAMPKGVDRAMGRLSNTKLNWGRDANGNALAGPWSWVQRTAAGAASASISGVGHAGQNITQRLGTKQNIKAVEEEKKIAASRTQEENTTAIGKTNDPAKILAAVMALAEKKQIKDAIRSGAISPEKLQKIYEMVLKGGPNMKKERDALERNFGGNDKYAPTLARTLSEQLPYQPVRDARGNIVKDSKGNTKYEGCGNDGLTDEDRALGYKTLQEKIVANARSKEDLDTIVMDPKELARIIGKNGTRQQVGWASEKHGPEFRKALQEYMKESLEKAQAAGDEKKIFDYVSEDVMRYAASNTGDINPVSQAFDKDGKVTKAYREYSRPTPQPITVGSVNEALNPSPALETQLDAERAIFEAKETEAKKTASLKANKELAYATQARRRAAYERLQAQQRLDDLANNPMAVTQDELIDAQRQLITAEEKLEQARQNFDAAKLQGYHKEYVLTESSQDLVETEARNRVAKTGLNISANPGEATTEDPSEFYKSIGASRQDIIRLAIDPDSGFNFSELTTSIGKLGEEFGETFRSYVQDQYNQNRAQNREIWNMFGTMNKETMLKFFTTEGRRLNGLGGIIDQQTQTVINLSEDEIDALQKMYEQNHGVNP